MQQTTFFSLEQVIDRQPLTVAPNTPFTEVIGLMQSWGNSCNVAEHETDISHNNSCVLVVEAGYLQGIFTERDLVKLVAKGINPQNATVGEMMTQKVITLTPTGKEDVFTVLDLFKKNRIRHLPIVDDERHLIGLITAKSLRQKLQPVNLMKWRKVAEIMEKEVVYTTPEASIRSVAVLMAEQDISCVAICTTDSSIARPVGIITERDLVQFQNLNIDFELPARDLMSAPLFLVSTEDSLWNVYQQMQQRRVRRLLVSSRAGELAGIITQSSLLQILDPHEMYGTIEMLQRQVCELETERERSLLDRNNELEREARERMAVIAAQNRELAFHMNNSPLAVVEWDSNFRVKRWSERAEQMFGWHEAEIIGKRWNDWQFVFEADLDSVSKITERLLQGIEPRNVSPNRNYTKNGRVVYCEWHNSVLLDESGNLVSILSLAQNVSDRTKVRAQLRNRIRQQQAITELGAIALSTRNLNEILARAVRLVADTLEVEYCQVLELSSDRQNLLLTAGVGWHAGTIGTATLNADKNSQAGYTLQQSCPVIVTDLSQETRFSGSLLLFDHQVVSGMSIAIPNGDGAFGVLGTHTTKRRLFNQDDINFLSAIANIIAQANERLQAETALQANEQKFNSILSSLNDIVWSADAQTLKPIYINRAAEKIFHRQVAEFYQHSNLWLEIVHPEDRDRVSQFYHIAIERGSCEMEYRIVRPDGEIRWLLDRANLTRDENDRPLRIDGNSTDISDRKQMELALKESQSRYTLAVEGSSSALWDWNVLTDEVFYAPRWQDILRCSDADLPNTFEAWSNRLHPQDRDRAMAALNAHLKDRIPYNIEYRLRRNDGDYCWVLARGQAIWNESGQPIRMAGSIDDISEQQAALRERKHREDILKDIASGISVDVGENFLTSLVTYLSKTLRVDYAYVGSLVPETNEVETLAVCSQGQIVNNFAYSLPGTPCLNVVEQQLCIYAESVQQLFPESKLLADMEAESFAGMPIYSSEGKVLGLICIVDRQPLKDLATIEEVLKIFATRTTTELERQQVELSLKQSEQKLKVIFDNSFQFIGLLEPNGVSIEANKTALDFVGVTMADVRGKLFWQTPWWSGSALARELIERGIIKAAQGEFVRFEVEHPGIDNRVLTVDFSLTPIKDETGKVVLLIPEGRNISERKQAEAELNKSNQILQAISSIQTQYLSEVEPGRLFDGMLEHLLELTQSEYGFIGEINIAEDGCPVMEESYMKFRGRPYLKTHAITNIAWNDETRAFYAENAPKGMEFHNLQTLFGAVIVTGDPVIANSPSDDPRRGGLPDGHPPLNAFLGVPFYKNEKMTGMVGIANKQGGYDEMLVHYLRPFLDTCSRIIEAYQSDRQRQRTEIKNREQAALLDVATDAIMVRGLDNELLFWNQGAERLYGWTADEALRQDPKGLLYRRSLSRLAEIQQEAIALGEWQGELNQITKAGREILVRSRWTVVRNEAGKPEAFLVVNTDITEQKQLETQFLRTQRLESLGTLAGGIAHDLNNILAPILGFSKLLPLKLPNVDEQTLGFFKIMETNANRGTALVKQILTFSRGLEGERGIVQIRHLISEIAQIITETFPKSIELETNAPKTLWTVNADVNQLHQVLMNLSVNARDAMPEGGKLIINAKNVNIDPEYARLHLDAKVGSYILITISDTGVGIAPAVIDRIFEPFFTTKEIGQGTGLGLSTVIGIVQSHGGFVEVMSQQQDKGRGTEFKVFLPASNIIENNIEETEEDLQGDGELVLVVDDEKAMLEVTKATLETYNYRVIVANNGIEAIATYAQNKDAIDLIIMDIMMPEMDGKTAIRTIKKINSNAMIIAVSGLITSQEIIRELDDDVNAFMNKPYNNDDLLKTVHEIVRN